MTSAARNYSDSRTASGSLVFVSGQIPLDDLRAVLASRLLQPRPAATLVGVQALIDPRFLIEIDAVASV